MSTETANPQVEQENLISQLSADIIKKNIKPYQGRSIQARLERDVRISLFVEEVDTEDYEKTVVFEDTSLGQKIDIKRLSSMYDYEKTKDALVSDGNGGLVLPYQQGEVLYDQMAEQGCPVGITIKDIKGKDEEVIKTFVGINQRFLEKTRDQENMRAAYRAKGYDDKAENLPLIICKKNDNATDPENWRTVQLTLVIPHFA